MGSKLSSVQRPSALPSESQQRIQVPYRILIYSVEIATGITKLLNKLEENDSKDDAELCDEQPSSWAIIFDNGDTKLAFFVKLSWKKTRLTGGALSTRLCKNRIAFGRVFIENYFAMWCCFTLFGSNWRWDIHRYSTF